MNHLVTCIFRYALSSNNFKDHTPIKIGTANITRFKSIKHFISKIFQFYLLRLSNCLLPIYVPY